MASMLEDPADASAAISPAGPARAWSATSWEARLLAGSVRSVAVTLVHGASVADRGALLRQGVLPLLGRRAHDQPARARAGCAPPATGSHQQGPLRRPRGGSEHVIFIDLQGGRELPPLQRALESARLDGRPGIDGGRVLLLLHDLGPPPADDPTAGADFWQPLLRSLLDPAQTLQLLITADSPTAPALGGLARRLPAFADNALQLTAAEPAATPLLQRSSQAPGLKPGNARPDEPTIAQPPPDAQRQAALQRAAARVAEHERLLAEAGAEAGPITAWPPLPACSWEDSVDAPPAGASADHPQEAAEAATWGGFDKPAPEPAAQTASAAEAVAVPAASDGSGRKRLRVPRQAAMAATAVAAVALGVVYGLVRQGPMSTASGPLTAAAANAWPTTATRPATQPAPPEPLEPGRALLQALAPLPVVDLRLGRDGVVQGLLKPRQATLALLRYDALQRLPADRRLQGLALVAPLYIEPVNAWVEAGSPVRHWHELRGLRMDIGPADGASALTAGSVYRALFGRDLPPAQRQHGSDGDSDGATGAGLQQRRAAAVLRVGDGPWHTAGGPPLRALTLAADDVSTTAALRHYLPRAVPDSATGGRSLAVMDFLVVHGGDGAERERLAGAAMRALCLALPQLRAGSGRAVWASVRPEIALPAGRPYAAAALQAAADCASATAGESAPPRSALALTSQPPSPIHRDRKGASQ